MKRLISLLSRNTIRKLPLLALLTLIVPLGLTFYAWQMAVADEQRDAFSQFQNLALENEKALLHHVDTYNYALLGGAGFFQGSEFVSRNEWKNYVATMDIKHNFPGINGIGVIDEIAAADAAPFIARMREDGEPDYTIHPETPGKPLYPVTYIEPHTTNSIIIGLNVAFEKNRQEAAELARDSGLPAITHKIVLLDDTEKTPGFLMLYPMYHLDRPLTTPDQRRAAFTGWVYAPFIAKNFLIDLTNSQSENLQLEVYDGDTITPENVIYKENAAQEEKIDKAHGFMVRKTIPIMQRNWTLVWRSTKTFGQQSHGRNPLLILIGGLLFSGLFGMFLLTATLRDTDTVERFAGERRWALPIIIFVVTALGSFYLYDMLNRQETEYVRNTIDEETNKIKQIISFQTTEKIFALKRMAQRWEASGGTLPDQWHADARNYVDQLVGLRQVEWLDRDYRHRWVEPENRNGIIDTGIEPGLQASLRTSAEKNAITLTPPLASPKGETSFVAYAALRNRGNFDGFLVGTFAADAFFQNLISKETAQKYAVYIAYDGKEFFHNAVASQKLEPTLGNTGSLPLYDLNCVIRVVPTAEFVADQKSILPTIVLLSGLLIALLLSLTVRYILISRVRSNYLKASEDTFRTAITHASIGMALVGIDGKWLSVNQALCTLLGYSEAELLVLDFQSITHPDDLQADLDSINRLIQGEIQAYQMEKRYYQRDGHVIWALLNVSLARHADGKPKYFISQIQDITKQKEMDRMKSEFISIVSHELRTPLTSIRGSLGLIMGTLTAGLPGRVNRLIEIAHENSERLITLINDILDIDKIASGQMRFNMGNERLSPLLEKAVEANLAYAQKFTVRLYLKPVDDRLVINVDRDRFMQVMGNFVSNAAKFSEEGSEIDIFAVVRDNVVRISVKDYGSGIPEDFKTRIFGKFSQADSSNARNKGGTGLGLNISKEIVERMGGHIGFTSEVGKGTIFWVEFPTAYAESALPLTAKTENVVVVEDIAPAPLPRILHVEDDASLVDFFISALQDKVVVVPAKTLLEAKQKLMVDNFSLIILDIGMPDGSGVDLLGFLSQSEFKKIPVVILSALEASDEIRQRVAAHMVKSRMSEVRIIEEILTMLGKENGTSHD